MLKLYIDKRAVPVPCALLSCEELNYGPSGDTAKGSPESTPGLSQLAQSTANDAEDNDRKSTLDSGSMIDGNASDLAGIALYEQLKRNGYKGDQSSVWCVQLFHTMRSPAR